MSAFRQQLTVVKNYDKELIMKMQAGGSPESDHHWVNVEKIYLKISG